MNNQIISYWDWLLLPFYILAIYIIASYIKNREIKKNPVYKYFMWGLFVKIFGAVSVCLIYVYYYKEGGDTFSYHKDGVALVDLLFRDPGYFMKVFFTPFKHEYLIETGYLEYWNNNQAFNTDRFVTVLEILGGRSYMISSVLMAVLSFTGVWKLYLTFCYCYPKLYKQFAIAILFIPSVVFWGSGLLKDSLTFCASGWYVFSFFSIFIKKQNIFVNVVTLIISICVMIMIKPYIFIALLPGSVLWMIWERLLKIKNIFLRVFIAPMIVGLGLLFGVLLWALTSSSFGEYSDVDAMVKKAYISYIDLKSEHYHGNSFDLGEYDPTLSGIMSKFPATVNAGLFRPYLWEAKNPVMVISGVENLIFLSLVLFFLFRKPLAFIRSLFTNPLVLFSVIFSIFFAFSVAISTSNFGAMVRLRIPALPFFISAIILIEYLSREKKKIFLQYSRKEN